MVGFILVSFYLFFVIFVESSQSCFDEMNSIYWSTGHEVKVYIVIRVAASQVWLVFSGVA